MKCYGINRNFPNLATISVFQITINVTLEYKHQIRRKVENLNIILVTKFVFQNTLGLSTNFVKREKEIRDTACLFIAVFAIVKSLLYIRELNETWIFVFSDS